MARGTKKVESHCSKECYQTLKAQCCNETLTRGVFQFEFATKDYGKSRTYYVAKTFYGLYKKSKHFPNELRGSSDYVYQIHSLRQLVAQALDDNRIHVLYDSNLSQKAYFRSRCLKAVSLLGFDWTCFSVHPKRVIIKSAIAMVLTMTSSQMKYWLQKGYCRSC